MLNKQKNNYLIKVNFLFKFFIKYKYLFKSIIYLFFII